MVTGRITEKVRARFKHGGSVGFGLDRLGLVTLKFPLVAAAILLVLTAVAIWQVPRANVDGDLLRVYKNSGTEYNTYANLSNTFGTFENDIYLLVTSPSLTQPETLEKIREMALELSLNDYAAGTLSPFALRRPDGDGGTVPAVPENMADPAEVAASLTDLQQNDPMMRNLINPDLSGVVMILFPDPELTRDGGMTEMVASLRDMISLYEGPDIQVELTGPPIWTSEMLNAAVDDQMTFTIYGFGLGALIALFSLRSFWAAILVAATPFVAVFWTMGVVLMIFGSFSFLTIIVTTLVLVICFAESLFFIFNWLAYWRDGMDPKAAIRQTITHVGPPAALSLLTTTIAFGSLGLTPGQGTSEFAVAGMIACVLTFVGIMCFLPLILQLALKLGFKLPKAPSMAMMAPVPASWWLATRFGRPIALLGIVATVLLLVPYLAIQPRFSFEDVMREGSSALTAAEQIDDGVGGVAPLYVSLPLTEGLESVGDEDFARIRSVHEILERHLGQNKVISAASFRHYSDSGFTRDEVFEAVGPFLKRRFVTDDGTQALVTGFMPTIIASDDLKVLVDGIRTDLAAENLPQAEVGGFRILTTFATDSIVRSLQLALTASAIINLVIITFAFGSWRMGLVSIVPNLFPVLGTVGYLWLAGEGLQLTTVLALTIAFGIAVDDTIHFLAHYVDERREAGLKHIDAVKATMERIGGAIIATTIILCAGTAIVMFSALPQVALFGTLFVVALALALFGDLFILPALLVAGGRFFHPLGGIKK